jgi:hypothetical protein
VVPAAIARTSTKIGSFNVAGVGGIEMSTNYRAVKTIRIADLFDGRMLEFGIDEHFSSDGRRCLTDARNFLWVGTDERGLVTGFSRYAGNDGEYILETISELFETQIYSEHKPEYYGFKTEAEFRAAELAWVAEQEQAERDCYDQIAKYVRGDTHEIRPGTIVMTKAEIAKRLALETPALLENEKRADLIKAVERLYYRQARADDDEIPF